MGAVTLSTVQVYTPPSDYVATLNLRVFSPNSATAVFNIGFAQSATNSITSFIKFQSPISAGGELEIKGIVMRNPQTLLMNNSASQALYVNVWGFEEESL